MKLGSLVDVLGWTHVVVHEPTRGIVELCRRGSARWMMPRWVNVTKVSSATGQTKYYRDAKRSLLKAGFDPDGYKRIPAGRYGGVRMIVVGHIALEPA